MRQVKVLQLISAYRFRSHRHTNFDSLELWQQENVADLDSSFHNLTDADFQEGFNVGPFAGGKDTVKLGDLVVTLKQTCYGPIGVEYIHITNTEEKRWLQQRIGSSHAAFSSEKEKRLLSELTIAEGLERYLGARFPDARRSSLEGSDMLIPTFKEMIYHAGNNGTREVVLGMAHRGYLNVLVNVLSKRLQELFDEFVGRRKEHLGIGDVKYHTGFPSDIETEGGLVHLTLAFSPPHLEIVSPAVIGSVCACLDRLDKPNSNKVLPITIHGDVTVTGQDAVQETLNMSKTHGYEVDGTVHIVINNQVGFTTSNPLDAHPTPHCTDIGKMVQAPIFHVNADDPEMVAFATRLALDFRNTFKHDVFIDLMCYHRHDYNEAGEPSTTQLLIYRKIREHPAPHRICADRLEANRVATLEDATEMVNLHRDALDAGECVAREWRPVNMHSFAWSPCLNHEWDESHPNKVEMKRLQELAKRISTTSEVVEMQSRVVEVYGDRQAMAVGEKLFDWSGAENLAYAAPVDEGTPVRPSGEDFGRETLFYRHAVIHNQANGSTYTPLQHVYNGQGTFRVWDSVLSEEAVLALECGYTIAGPCTLTIWEAQFGDLANDAQVVTDQFISSGEQKRGRMYDLAILLPHGYEGQGPEHSSACLRRYLQLCTEQNTQVCIPSTPVQAYRVLRRQALRGMRRPLVVMLPKSLLRHPLTVSTLDGLANGTFLPAIGGADELNPRGVKRTVICPGKVYYDLLEQRRKDDQKDVAIVRIEQLYPFPHKAVQEALKPFVHVHDFVQCQEESFNQGAWHYNQHHLREVTPFKSALRYADRPASVFPAVGYMSIHQRQQQDLVNDALSVG